jgi:NADH-quinone oxidoreductase subunit M
MATATEYLVVMAIPIAGAAVGLLMWKNVQALKVCLLVTTLISLVSIVALATTSEIPLPEGRGLLLLLLLPTTTFVTMLGQPAHRSLRVPWLLSLVLTGLGLGVLSFEAPLSLIFFLLVLAVVGLMFFQYARLPKVNAMLSIGTIVFGILSLIVAGITTPPVSSIALAMACAMMLPLVPFHKGYVCALTALPGNLPAFLAVLLPVIGFDQLLTVLPVFPNRAAHAAAILAFVGLIYGSLKALTQSRATSIVAYGSLAFFSIAWWHLITIGTAVPHSIIYISGVALAASALLVALYVLRVRYGEITLRAVGGLAQPMPRFAVALSLVALAALGMPPFAVFSGFVGMVLAPALRNAGAFSAGLVGILIAWLAASSYFFGLAQTLLFGPQRPESGHHDLRAPELASLAILLAFLVALGVMPVGFFAGEPISEQNVMHENLTQVTGHSAVGREIPAWLK